MPPNPRLSKAHGDSCPARPRVYKRLEDSAARFSDRLAIASLHQAPDLYSIAEAGSSDQGYLRWSYAQLNTAVDRFAAGLQQLGLVRGDTLATYLTNGVELVLSFWAAHRLGCTFAPLSSHSMRNEQESGRVLGLLRPAAVIVDSVEAASRLDKVLTRSASVANKILVGNALPDSLSSWRLFATLLVRDCMSNGIGNGIGNGTGNGTVDGDHVAERESIVAILFTSGTTLAPKGAPHTDTTLNAFCENFSLGDSSEDHVFCSVLPNNHAMGYFVLHFMMNGGAVMYPSPSFDPERMLEALQRERATHTTLVPATVHALVEALEARDGPLDSSLLDVCLAGSSVTPDNLRFVVDRLGSRAVSTGFGMTEGSPVWTAPTANPEALINGKGIYSGKPSPGASVKICTQESQEPLPLHQPGELHQSGPGLIASYLGSCADNDQFYLDDEGCPCFVTGDQAVLHPDGRVSITGRYKDVINRGGEKIAPAAMEAIIQGACGLEVQVVGASDPFAGQVPVVVVKNGSHMNIKAIREAVAQEMGPAYALDEVVARQELGIGDFPKTVSGKIQRAALASRVSEMKDKRDRPEQSRRSIKEDVLRAYRIATGIAAEDLDVAAPTALFMDSIVSMRVRDRLRKDAGLTLSIGDMASHATIDRQIALLEERGSPEHATNDSEVLPQHSTAESGLSTFLGDADADEARRLEAVISTTVEAQGLSYESVADIIPVPDILAVLTSSGIIDSCNFAIAVAAEGSTTEVRELCLAPVVPRQPNPESPDGEDHAFDAPGILDFKRENPGMSGAILFKAAMTLVNVSRTNHTHALFKNFEAGRERFPFIPSSLEALSAGRLQASDVNGPVMQSVCNLIHVIRDETALCFLGRLQAEQSELTQHAHAPLRRIVDALRTEGNQADELLIDAQRGQFISWAPGFLGEYERLQVSQVAIRTAVGLIVIGGLGGPRATTFQFSARWDGANFSRDKTASFLADLEAAIVWLCEKSNWDKPVGRFLQGICR